MVVNELQHSSQDGMQNPTIAIILDLYVGVQARDGFEDELPAIGAHGTDHHLALRDNAIVQPFDMENLLPGQPKGIDILSRQKL